MMPLYAAAVTGEMLLTLTGLAFSLVAFMLAPLGTLAWYVFKRVQSSLDAHAAALAEARVEDAKMRTEWVASQKRLADFEARLLEKVGALGTQAHEILTQTQTHAVHLADLERRVATAESTHDSLEDLHDKLDVLLGTPPDGVERRLVARTRRRQSGVRGGSGSLPPEATKGSP